MKTLIIFLFIFLTSLQIIIAQEQHIYSEKENAYVNYIKPTGQPAYPWAHNEHRIGFWTDGNNYDVANFNCWNWTQDTIPQEATVTSVNIKFRARKRNYSHTLKFYLYNIPYTINSGTNLYDQCTVNNLVYTSEEYNQNANYDVLVDLTFTSQSPVENGWKVWNAINNAVKSGNYYLTLGIREAPNSLYPTWNLIQFDDPINFFKPAIDLTIYFTTPNNYYTFKNKIQNTENYGTLILNNDLLNPIASGNDSIFLAWGSQNTIRTNELPFIVNWNNTNNVQKHNYWDLLTSGQEYSLHHSFQSVPSSPSEMKATFLPTANTVIKNYFSEMNSSSLGNIYFNDPWFYYGDQNYNWFQSNECYQYTSPFEIQNNSTNSYGGVFLNQGIDWQPPYYSVKAEAVQSINLGGSLGTRDFYFQNWSRDYISGQPSAEFWDSMALQTGVVFKQQNAVVKANLKGHLLSGATTGFSSNSQRKIVRTDDGKLHLVYESMGSAWYTISTDNGITWQPEQRLNPYSTYAKGVSIAQSDDGLNYVYIVYQIDRDVFPNLSKGVVITQYHYGVQQWANTVYSLSTYDYDTKPVVAAQNNVAYVVFKPTSSSQLRAAKVRSSGVVYTSFALNNTTSGSVNPSLAAAVQNFYLAYQNNSTEIRYFKFSVNGSISDYAVVSSGSGFTYNINPSLSTHAGDPVISWSGYTSSIPTIVIRRKSGSTWSTFKQCSNGSAAYPSNNNSKGSGNDGSIIAWTNMYNQSQYIKFVNGEYSTIKTLPYSGQDIQIGNGNEFEQLKAVTFNRSGSAPYGINPLQYNFNTMQKTTTEEDFNYARIAVIGKENAEIVYGLGDIKLNNENILFTRLNDMVQINNTQDLSSAMKTENFVLSKESKLEFSDCAYVIKGDSVNLTASEILPIIELVNLSNGQALKVKDISISIKDTIDEKTYYVLNCSYLPEGTYYLRVNLDTEEQYEYNISDCIYEENEQLRKKDYKEIVLEDNLLPKEFSLEQNHPNPFNPSTTIKYQIPASLNPSKGGTLVTLKVYDILGKEVATLVNEEKPAGRYEVNFNASSLASGVYIYKLQAGQSFVASKKMLLLK